ncbi:MAG: phosphoribosylglycinamide formyltransferase [Pyrinomonadaceae bacterium MAG19_C2-C3]|nr:phosphoribosylglycinamide formyltransferase [Pyrinomonadaceae bacterium MAG19_C2-C3]
MTSRIAILISGRGSNMLALADAIERGEIPRAELALVISDHAHAHGLTHAHTRGIETLVIEREGRTRDAHDTEIIRALEAHDIHFICLAGYMRLLSPSFINAFPNRILNIHPSLLPAFPGLHAQRQALDYGVKVTGCTVHFVDEGLDSGAIIAQTCVPVLDDDTEETLSARILAEEHKLYPRALKQIIDAKFEMQDRRIRL